MVGIMEHEYFDGGRHRKKKKCDIDFVTISTLFAPARIDYSGDYKVHASHSCAYSPTCTSRWKHSLMPTLSHIHNEVYVDRI